MGVIFRMTNFLLDIHGDEVTGVIVAHRIIEWLSNLESSQMKGTVVIIPSLNPSGLMNGSRYPAFDPQDPNRTFPDSKISTDEKVPDILEKDAWYNIHKSVADRKKPQDKASEIVWKIIVDEIKPSFHLDLHTFSSLSIPFIFLDRLLFDETKHTKEESQELWTKTNDFVHAIGLSVILEHPIHYYIKHKLHRSTSGATLNNLGIPSCTIELGPMNCVPPNVRESGIKAVKNALIYSGFLQNFEFFEITEVPVFKFDVPHRYLVYPQANETGIVDILVPCGEQYTEGQTLAIIRDISGIEKDKIIATNSGYVMGWFNGITVFKDQPLGIVAVKDEDAPVVFSWQELLKDSFIS